MNYGNRLKWLIKNKGFSQREIAAELGVPESTLSDWTVKDYPSLEHIEAVCRVLQIPVSRFFAEDSDQYVEVSLQEQELLKVFNTFSDEQKEKLLEVVDILKGF
jgi:transcriptional regulator with XRE-family HTH domain